VTDETADGPGYAIAEDGSFTAPLTLAYPYSRTVGPTYGTFLTGLAAGTVKATVSADGTVFVPPAEFHAVTGEALTNWVDVASEGEVVSWSWEATPGDAQPFNRPFAWVLVKLDGADTSMLHALDVTDPADVTTGMRVRVRFAPDAEPGIEAIACFEPVTTGGAS
jgi:hypothetical protein